MGVHLENFRQVYTLNYSTEKHIQDDPDRDVVVINVTKVLMWIPIIAQIASIGLLILNKKNVIKTFTTSEKRLNNIAFISRCAIGFFASLLLCPIDLIGTIVKLYIDYRNKQQGL